MWKFEIYLPVDRKAVDEDWVAFLGSGLAQALEENKDAWSLRVVQPRVVAAHDIIQEYVDVGHLVRMERSDQLVRIRDQITLRSDQLEDEADLDYLCFFERLGHWRWG